MVTIAWRHHSRLLSRVAVGVGVGGLWGRGRRRLELGSLGVRPRGPQRIVASVWPYSATTTARRTAK